MKLQSFKSIKLINSALLSLNCALFVMLLAACSAKTIEPMQLMAKPSLSTDRPIHDEPSNFGVPSVSTILFSQGADAQFVDMTY